MAGIYGDVRLDAMGTDPDPNVRRPDPEQDTKALPPGGASDFTGKGELLEEPDPKKVFKAIDKIVEDQEQLAKNREAARKHRARVRKGIPFSVLNKDEDRNVWTAELPPGGSDQPSPIPNKADELCRKTVGQIIVDLPQPDPKPATDSEQDRGAADLAKRFLKADGDESGTNDAALFRDALDNAQTDASAFAHVWVDESGGGWRPMRIKAHPMATDASNPLIAQDPMTGQMVPTSDYILRYVNDAGQFVETAAEAAKQWLPKLRVDLLGPQHVRTSPETADVGNSDAVVLLMVAPLGDLKRRVPALAEWEEAELSRLLEWRPRRAKALVPASLKARFKSQTSEKGGHQVSDSSLVFWYHKYCRISKQYPEGASILVSGADGGLTLDKGTLRTDLPDEDEDVKVLLGDIAVSQCRALSDPDGKDPMGIAPIDIYGATNEGLAQLYGAALEDTDRRLHPNVFLPATSPVQAWQLTQRNGEPIPVLSKDDLPKYEEFADMAAFLPQMTEMLEDSMREAAGLGSAAENLNTPDAKSGKAKELELGQAKVNLWPQAQNFFSFVKRYWRVKLQLAQAKLTLPQQVEYAGVDAAYKQRWWTGADFAGVKDVAIAAGSGTLMSPTEKQQFLAFAQGQLWLEADEAAEVGRGTMSDDLGLKTSPHEETIRRELAQWMDGPPEQWQPAQPPPTDPRTGQPAVDPNTGQPAQGTPASWTPFVVRPSNDDQSVAKKQYKILNDFCASADYVKHPPEWRALLDARLVQARQAAGIQTVAEAQAAQQAQAQAQAQQQQASEERQVGMKREERETQRAMKMDEMEHQSAMQDRKQMGEMKREGMRMQQPTT